MFNFGMIMMVFFTIELPKIFKFLNLDHDPKITKKVILDTELKVR